MPEVDSDKEEYLCTGDLDDVVWSEEPVLDSQEYLCIHPISRPATPPPQPNQVEMPLGPGQPASPLPQPDQVEMPQVPESMDIDILEDIPELIDIPKKYYQTDAWAHSVLEYQW